MSSKAPAAFMLALGLAIASVTSVAKSNASPRDLTAAIQEEVARARTLELDGMPRPYYVAVTLLGDQETMVAAALGSIIKQDYDRSRILKVEVRVGDMSFDSSNFFGSAEEPVVVAPATLEDDPDALRRTLWLLTDRTYKNASETFEAKRAHFESMARGQDDIDDFSTAPIVTSRDTERHPVPPSAPYALLARKASAVFAGYRDIHQSSVSIVARTRTRAFVDSAGTVIEDASSLLHIEMVARTQADDGMVLADYDTFSSRSFADLPTEQALVARAKAIAVRLVEARSAPVVEDYAGPVLFEGQAAPQLLRFLLADELSATPPAEPNMGGDVNARSSLSSRVGWRVLPLGFDVVDDPTVQVHVGLPLIGGYRLDDEGVKAARVDVVQNGRLRSLLSSRIPSITNSSSNGHGRSGVTGQARGRAGNVLVSVRGGQTLAALRQLLLASAKKEGVDYGIVVAGLEEPAVTGGIMTPGGAHGSVLPRPTVMYRIRAGAKPERVRGAALHALLSRDLRHVVAAGLQAHAYSYMASSSPVRSPGSFGGDIPTSIVAPSLLLPDVDVTKPTTPHPLPPIVPKPSE